MKFLVIISIFAFTDATRKIYGGDLIDIETVPYQAGVIVMGTLKCGGSFLSEKFVISAAHCTDKHGTGKDMYRISGGSIYSSKDLSSYFKVEDIVKHPKFSRERNFDYDFVLFRIADVEVFPEIIKFIALPSPNESIVEGEMMIISGWGSISFSDDERIFPKKLQGAKIPIADQKLCAKNYKDKVVLEGKNTEITDRMVCAGYGVAGISTCPGDSGGPLAAANREMPILIGITSFSVNCGSTSGYPNVFAKVSAVLPWINEVMTEEN